VVTAPTIEQHLARPPGTAAAPAALRPAPAGRSPVAVRPSQAPASRLRLVPAADPSEGLADAFASRVVPGPRRHSALSASPYAEPLPERMIERAARSPGGRVPSSLALTAAESFSDVRVHTGREAQLAAALLGAQAFTVGRDIGFAKGAYRPDTPHGAHLIAHELGHVRQQRTGSPRVHRRPSADATQLAIDSSWAMELSEADLDEQIALVQDRLVRIGATNAESEQLVANLAVLDAEKARKGKVAAHRAERQERLKVETQIVKQGAKIALFGGPVLGVLGIGPIVATFVSEVAQGIWEGIDELPDDLKAALKQKFYKLYFTWGDWDDKKEYAIGYLEGIGEGVWDEIKGIGEFFWMLAQLNQKLNDWIAAQIESAFSGELAAKGASIRNRVGKAIDAVRREIEEFIKNPVEGVKKIKAALESMLKNALGKANEIGHDAVASAVRFLSQPLRPLGEGIGKVVGSLIFNVVLLVASDAIGNLVKEGLAVLTKIGKTLLEGALDLFRGIASFVTKAWEIAKGALAKLVSSEAFAELSKAIEEFIEWLKGVKAPEAPAAKAAEDVGKAGSVPGGAKPKELYTPKEGPPEVTPHGKPEPKLEAKPQAPPEAELSEVEQEFAEAQEMVGEDELNREALENYGVEERKTPGGPIPEHFDLGNFAHDNAEALIPKSELPRGLEPEFKITLKDGSVRRIDRLDRANGVVYEIKPDTPKWRRAGQKQAELYAKWLDASEYKLPGGKKWQFKVVTYDAARLRRAFKEVGELSRWMK